MNAQSRRAFLTTGTAALAGAAAITPIFAKAADQEPVRALWAEWLQAKADTARASRLHDEAEAGMPWWAKSGPSYINHEGKPFGDKTGWPAIQDMEPPEYASARRLIRPSPQDLKENYRLLSGWGGYHAKLAKGAYRKQLRELALRKRAQKAEEAKANVPALNKLWEDACDIEDAIQALPTTPNALAAKVMVLTAFGMSNESSFNSKAASACVLDALRPDLSGLVGTYVEHLLTTERKKPVRETFLRLGLLAPALPSA